MSKECCATCHHWVKQYWLCSCHSQAARGRELYASPDAEPYGSPPEKVCEFYERDEGDFP